MIIAYIICGIVATICVLGNLFLYFFTYHCWVNRKELRLGYSRMKATWLDMVFITLMPFLTSFLIYITFYEAIYKNI